MWTGVLFLCIAGAGAITRDQFYPYGHGVDQRLPRGSSVSSPEISLNVPIVFFGETYETIFVNNYGILSFRTDIPTFLNAEFPLPYPSIAAFYSNVDTTNSGDVYYRETNESHVLTKAEDIVQNNFHDYYEFRPTSVFIATWIDVTYSSTQWQDRKNSFQIAVISNGTETFVQLLYPEREIQWIQRETQPSSLPDAKAQAGFVADDGRLFTLRGSGSHQIRNVVSWSNTQEPGVYLFRVGNILMNETVAVPDQYDENEVEVEEETKTCAQTGPSLCHLQAKCVDYQAGICCQCNEGFYGNGKSCIKDDVPLRVHGKLNGIINNVNLNDVDIQAYVVIADGRTYTALSQGPHSLGPSLQLLNTLGGVIGWLFAKPSGTAKNGYQLTGGVFNHTADIYFPETKDRVTINQEFIGHDVFDQLTLDVDVRGTIPNVIPGSRLEISEYDEQYTIVEPGQIHSISSRVFKNKITGQNYEQRVSQTFVFSPCKYAPPSEEDAVPVTLKVVKNYLGFESRDNIVRYGSSNKITSNSQEDPCVEGRDSCGPHSTCVVQGDSFACICQPGFTSIYYGSSNICVDIDECEALTHNCDSNADCYNHEGGFQCRCREGYEGNGVSCSYVSRCGNKICDSNAQCISNLIDEPLCLCKPGYTGDGQRCWRAVDSCNCSPFAHCSFFAESNSYRCECNSGYIGDGRYCTEDINQQTEFEERPKPTPAQEEPAPVQVPERELYQEQDKELYPILEPRPYYPSSSQEQLYPILEPRPYYPSSSQELDQVTVSEPYPTSEPEQNQRTEQGADVTASSTEFVSTTEPYTLVHTEPSTLVHTDAEYNATYVLGHCDAYGCVCPPGYTLTKYQSSDLCRLDTYRESGVDENGDSSITCSADADCPPNAICSFSSESSYLTNDQSLGHCICPEGYEGDAYECIERTGSSCSCGPSAHCVDTATGELMCVCDPGYHGDGYVCRPNFSCTSDSDCEYNADCRPDPNTNEYVCQCSDGFIKDQNDACIPDAQLCNGAVCAEHASCLYNATLDVYYCRCDEGYEGEGISQCVLQGKTCDVANDCSPDAICTPTESNYQCICREGYFGDGYRCEPELNCRTNIYLCDIHASCLKTSDGYGCECNTGYNGNGSHCTLNPRQAGNFLIASDGASVYRVPFKVTPREFATPFNSAIYQIAVGIDTDCLTGKIYWGDVGAGAIKRASYDGSDFEQFLSYDVQSPEGLAVDWAARNIFWTDSKKLTIEVANLDTKVRKVLFHKEGIMNPRGIAVHPGKGKIFWTDWNRGGPKIEWANMDGSQRGVFLDMADIKLPNSLAIDWSRDRLCYTDAGFYNIRCVSIDTNESETIASNCSYPFGLAINGDDYYWTDWKTLKIEYINNLTQTKGQVPIATASRRLYGVTVAPESCPAQSNICQYRNGQCEPNQLCLPDGQGSRTCVSGDNRY